MVTPQVAAHVQCPAPTATGHPVRGAHLDRYSVAVSVMGRTAVLHAFTLRDAFSAYDLLVLRAHVLLFGRKRDALFHNHGITLAAERGERHFRCWIRSYGPPFCSRHPLGEIHRENVQSPRLAFDGMPCLDELVFENLHRFFSAAEHRPESKTPHLWCTHRVQRVHDTLFPREQPFVAPLSLGPLVGLRGPAGIVQRPYEAADHSGAIVYR